MVGSLDRLEFGSAPSSPSWSDVGARLVRRWGILVLKLAPPSCGHQRRFQECIYIDLFEEKCILNSKSTLIPLEYYLTF